VTVKVNPFQAERVESSHANLANFLEARLLTASEALNHLRELSREVGLSEVIAPTCPLSHDTHFQSALQSVETSPCAYLQGRPLAVT
jgi:hypothetical protein